ncbi:MAG: hypothetical protein WCO21_03325 [bacterium]
MSEVIYHEVEVCMTQEKRMPGLTHLPLWQECFYWLVLRDPQNARIVMHRIKVEQLDEAILIKFLNSETAEIRDLGRELVIMREFKEENVGSIKESFFRLFIFVSMCVVLVWFFSFAFVKKPDIVSTGQGAGYLAGFGILFGVAALCELAILFSHLYRRIFK